MEINSSKNPTIKLVKSLYQKKIREKEQKFVLEGIRTIGLAMESGAICHAILATPGVYESLEESLSQMNTAEEPIKYKVTPQVFKEIASTESPQGVLGIMRLPEKKGDLELMRFLESNAHVDNILLLDRIQDPGNMGTIIRTADAAGIQVIILIKGCVDVYNEKVVRSTMGSVLNISFFESDNALKTVDQLKKKGFHLVASALEKALDYAAKDAFNQKNCLIIGNEGNGVDYDLIHVADQVVKIPILGKAESLNAAVATGILIYKMLESKDNM